MEDQTKPLYEHDCKECKFLGTFNSKDLYYCPKGLTTIIARDSSRGGDYTSVWFSLIVF